MALNKINKEHLKIFSIEDFTIEVSSVKPSGSFGEISRAVINDGNIPVVLKKYKEHISNSIFKKDINKEIIILQHLNQYPDTCSCKLYGICFEFNQKKDRYCYLVLERLETDLHKISVKYKNDATKNNGRFNPLQYKIIFYKCLKALNAIHSLGFIHNDIKLPNIMLNGTDIKFIDFGISKFLGLSSPYFQVNINYTTDIIEPPEKRISFSSDIFSLASTMIHLVSRTYMRVRCNFDSKDIYDADDKNPYTNFLKLDRTFGLDGYDLLCNLLNPDPLTRFCANKALLHPYFNEIREHNLNIDRSVVGLMGGRITGLENIVQYSRDNFEKKNLELCYYEELHINYKDDIFPIHHIDNVFEYNTLMNWLLQKFNHAIKPNYILYGLDTLLNGIIHTNNNYNKFCNTTLYNITPIINPIYVNTFANMFMFHNIFTEGSNDTENILELRIRTIEIVDTFYKNLDINISLFPISLHISYIYLQLLYNIQKLENSYEFSINFYYDVSIMIIFWFIQAIPFEKKISNWNIVVFSTIHLLSKILSLPGIELIQKPIIPSLVMDENLYTTMSQYYTHQFSTMDFERFTSFKIYFENL